MSEQSSYSRDLTLPHLPKRHGMFKEWEFEVRAKVNTLSSKHFDPYYLFQNITDEATEPWTYEPRGADREEKMHAYNKINGQVWSALLNVLKQAVKSENDGSATLKWNLFLQKVKTGIDLDVEVAQSRPAGTEEHYVPVYRKAMPEFNGQFLWSMMRRHVNQTSQPSIQKAKKEFHNLKLQGSKILEFIANVEEVGLEAEYPLLDQFLIVKSALEHSHEFRHMFLTWKLINRDSTDLQSLKTYFEGVEAEKHDRFKAKPTTQSSWRYGAAATEEWPEYVESSQEGQAFDPSWDWSDEYGNVLASIAEQGDSDHDETPGEP